MTEFNSLNPYKQFIFPKNNGVDRDFGHVYYINQNTSNPQKDEFQKQDKDTTEQKPEKKEKQTLFSKYKRELAGGAIALVLCGALMLLFKKGKPHNPPPSKPATQASDDITKKGGQTSSKAQDAAKGSSRNDVSNEATEELNKQLNELQELIRENQKLEQEMEELSQKAAAELQRQATETALRTNEEKLIEITQSLQEQLAQKQAQLRSLQLKNSELDKILAEKRETVKNLRALVDFCNSID